MPVKFIKANSNREDEFEKMVAAISHTSEVSKETIRTFGERALNAYGDKRLHLITELTEGKKKSELKYLKKYMHRYMHAVIPEGNKLTHSMRIAENSLKNIFNTP